MIEPKKTSVFRGATKPPMFLGVPLIPCVMVILLTFCISATAAMFYNLWGYLIMIVAPIIIWMLSEVSKRDDHLVNIYLTHIVSSIKYRFLGLIKRGKVTVLPPNSIKYRGQNVK
jgi:type IV secretion system protein VirB3